MIKSCCKFIVILTWLKLIFPVFIFLTLLQTCQTSAYNESQKNPRLHKKHRKENFHDHSFLVIYRNKWCKYYLTLERHSIKSFQNQNNLHPPKKWITYFTISDVWWKMIKKEKENFHLIFFSHHPTKWPEVLQLADGISWLFPNNSLWDFQYLYHQQLPEKHGLWTHVRPYQSLCELHPLTDH